MEDAGGRPTIDVLVIVDVEGALATKLEENVYMIDTNKHIGSGAAGSQGEGQMELETACVDNQVITWRITGVSPSSNVEIKEFTGQMVEEKICTPKLYTDAEGPYWQGAVEARGTTGRVQYSIVVVMDGHAESFDPFLMISAS